MPNPLPETRLRVGDRVQRLHGLPAGTIEEFEFPDGNGRVFVRTDSRADYWFHASEIRRECNV